jgi:hypothetical protein
MMEKGAQKAQIIGDINMAKVNKFMETLKMNPLQIGNSTLSKVHQMKCS